MRSLRTHAVQRAGTAILAIRRVAHLVAAYAGRHAGVIAADLVRPATTILWTGPAIFACVRITFAVTTPQYPHANAVDTRRIRWTRTAIDHLVAAVIPISALLTHLVTGIGRTAGAARHAHLAIFAPAILPATCTIFPLVPVTYTIPAVGRFHAMALETLGTWFACTTLDHLVAAVIPISALLTHLVTGIGRTTGAARHAYLAIFAPAISRAIRTIFAGIITTYAVTTNGVGDTVPLHTGFTGSAGTAIYPVATMVVNLAALETQLLAGLGDATRAAVLGTGVAIFTLVRLAPAVSTVSWDATHAISAHLSGFAPAVLGTGTAIFTQVRLAFPVSTEFLCHAFPMHT